MTETPRYNQHSINEVIRHSQQGVWTADTVGIILQLQADLEKAEQALAAHTVAWDAVIQPCYDELKKALGRDIECPAYIPDAIKELAALRGEPVAWRWRNVGEERYVGKGRWQYMSGRPETGEEEVEVQRLYAAPISGERAVPFEDYKLARDALLYWQYECSGAEPSLSVFNRMVDAALSQDHAAAVSGERVREACAKAICTRCDRGEPVVRILAGDWMHEKETDGVRHYIPCKADRIHALPLAAQPDPGEPVALLQEIIANDEDTMQSKMSHMNRNYEIVKRAKAAFLRDMPSPPDAPPRAVSGERAASFFCSAVPQCEKQCDSCHWADDHDDEQVDPDKVICPGCAHQFRAIPVNVQRELAAVSGERVREACAKVRAETIEQVVKELEDLPVTEASEYGFNRWQACAMLRKLAILKIRALQEKAK